MTTRAPAVKAALLTAFQAAAPLASVTWGHPGVDNADGDFAFLDKARVVQDWAALGRQRRDETIEIETVVLARSAESAQDVEQRAWDLAGLFEQKLRDDPTLGDVCLWSGVTQAQQANFSDGPQAYLAQIVLTVQARTRI